jgi:hypothetical protein
MRSTPVVLGFLSALTKMVSDQPWGRPPPYTRSIFKPSIARRKSAWLSSLVAWEENTTPTLFGARVRSARSRFAASVSATSRVTRRPPDDGRSTRSSCTALYSKRPSSHIQNLLTARFSRGTRRRILPREVWISMLQPVAQPGHTDGVENSSQARREKRKSLEVSAPTGHTSTVLSE